MPTRPGPVIFARLMADAAKQAGGELLHLDFHGDRGIFVQEGAWLDQDRLTRPQRALKDVAVTVQDQQARHVGGDKAVHEHALPAEENVAQALDADVRISDMVGGQQEGVLAHIQFHAGVQRQDHQLAGRIPEEGNPAWPGRQC